MTFGMLPLDVEVPDVRPGQPTGRPLRPPPRTIARWPFLLVVAGTVVAGPIGLVISSAVVGALLVLRLRLLVADPDVPDLVALPWRRRSPAPALPGFTRTVGSVEWGLTSAYDFDAALRPRLLRVAAVRLLESHGVDLYADRSAAARLLGAEAWTLLDPERPDIPDRSTPGPDSAALARVLDAIEQN
ncbi:MAG: hypothetical protein ACRD0W_06500 [Acidimicrobiales bacterium]